MSTVDVAIVGAGPTGLALAGELGLAGIRCRVLERRENQPNLTRAFAVHARTLELMAARGLAEKIVERGIVVRSVSPTPGATLDLTAVPTRYPMVLIVPQSGTEKILEERARELGVEISYGTEVTGLEQAADSVRLTVTGPADRHVTETVEASYVVGTDGAHSVVRDLIGVDFVGRQYETHIMLADVTLARPPGETLFGATNEHGLVLFVPFGDGWFRAIAWDRTREQVPLAEPITLAELRESFHRIAGDDYGMGEPRWRTRFLSERRQARSYRVGRVFLAGDAAHVHSPVGGQGMNTGIQDAMNLGWKLAATVHGFGGDELLDTYSGERHPVGAGVLALTDALYKLVMSSSTVGAAARRLAIRTALRLPPVRARLAGRITGIAIAYPRPAGSHRLTGTRQPLHDSETGTVYDALRTGHFVLVDRTGRTRELTGRSDRLSVVSLPRKDGAAALTLVRPDGYVAWASDDPAGSGLDAALRQWCGPLATSTA
jgi:2-polyprenyl-6-methoxyphenol hydroxylase-like FAD-dependent oxidoreductase